MRSAFVYILCPALLLLLAGNTISAQYCTPNSNPGIGTNINKVVLQDISNEHLWASGDPGYFDYTGVHQHRTNLKRGQLFNITITRATYYSSMRYAAWIDYNNDGDFYDNGEKLGETAASSTIATMTLSFTVPIESPVVSTRLRVRSANNGSASLMNPCDNYTYGETEDYAITITDFVRISTGITDGGSGDINLFNYDSDSDYDLFVQDEYSSTDPVMFFNYASGIYSLFDYINGTIPEPDNDNLSSTFCDLNNDNALDLLLTYRYGAELPRTIYYQKQSGLLNQLTTGMTNLMRGSTAAADLDNDGRQDVIVCGEDAGGVRYTNVYRNTTTGFVLVNTNLKGVRGQILTADFDNDKDIDIFLTGDDKYDNTNAIIYRNDNNWIFTNILADLNKCGWLQYSGLGDFNADGFTDLFISDKIYMNVGNKFLEIPIVCPEYYGARSWNDIDNDGFQELVGRDYQGIVILKYDGEKFVINQHLYTNNIEIYNTGDYNDDNKQDILFNLYNDIYFFKNLTSVPNAAPTVPNPLLLKSSVGSAGYYTVSLSWSDGTDDHTPGSGLSYNLRVGTSPEGNDIMSSMTSTSDKSLLIPGTGNVGYNNQWIIRDLAPGTYYWSVQSVDNSGVTSVFTSPLQFTIEPPFKNSTFDFIGTISAGGSGADLDRDSDIDLITFSDPELDGDPQLYLHEQVSLYSFVQHKIGKNYELTGIEDFNNDNLPDLIARHNKIFSVEPVDSVVLLINQGSLGFKLAKIDSATFSRAETADFDNDGDKDLLVHHYGYYLYRNDGSLMFTRQKLNLPDILDRYTNLLAFDIDNDSDFDFIVSGQDYDDNSRTLLYENKGNLSFALKQKFSPALGPTRYMPRSGIMITVPPDIVWNDFNFDGFPDLMITGDDDYGNTNNIIYLNDGTGNFILTELSPRPTDKYSTSWIDFNKDGLLDIIMPKMGLEVDNSIYLNINNSSWMPFPNILDNRNDATYIDVIDVDKDLDKDIVLNYRVLNGLSFYMKTTILTNTFNFANSPPSPPANIDAAIDSFDVDLTWSKGTDFLMGKEGFTYNIRVGSSPGAANIVSPLADLTTGFRYVEELGNVGTNTAWTLKNLPLGKYYWSVQTIDNSLQGSSWSPEDSFEISALTAEFASDEVCLGENTQFIDETVSTKTVSSYYWDFGGGNSSTLQNPVFKFPKAGNNSVKLVVTAGTIIDSVRKDVFVKPVPSVSFTAPDKCQGEATPFTNTSVLNGTTISSWSWNFGDGAVSALQDPGTHGYLNPGDYTVTLNAVASNACSATYSDNVSVGMYPVAAVTANAPLTFCKGDSVTLSVPYNSAYNFNWKLNGTALTGSVTNKVVAKISGSYVAVVTNPTGSCATSSPATSITALDAPATPVITAAGPTEFCQGDSVELSVTAAAGNAFSWRLNGGAVGSNKNTFTARLPGEYTVITANQSGCYASSSNIISVSVNPRPSTPVISISGSTTFCKGEYVTFRVPAIEGYAYSWNNDNGPIDGAVSNSFTAVSSGSYFLEISNQPGCVTITPSAKVTVKESPVTPVLIPSNYSKGVCPGEDPVRLSARTDNPDYNYLWYKDGQPLLNDTLSYIDLYEAGNYQLKAELNGCVAESSLSPIEFPAGPEIPVIYAQGPTFWYLAASNTKASRYKWYFNGKLLGDAGDYFFLANQKLGTYQVSVANDQGCYTRSAPITIPPGFTGIDDIDLSDNTIIYPNPNSGLFTVAIENQILGDVTIKITGLDGKEVKSFKLEKAFSYFSAQINLAGQPKGSYLVFITLEKYKIVRKVLIE